MEGGGRHIPIMAYTIAAPRGMDQRRYLQGCLRDPATLDALQKRVGYAPTSTQRLSTRCCKVLPARFVALLRGTFALHRGRKWPSASPSAPCGCTTRPFVPCSGWILLPSLRCFEHGTTGPGFELHANSCNRELGNIDVRDSGLCLRHGRMKSGEAGS